jgi:hypothetical protein
MNLEFGGAIWLWKGPAPWHFITVPEQECGELEATSASVSYGWGMIPVRAQIRGNRVEDLAVPQGWAVHRAGEGVGAVGRRA